MYCVSVGLTYVLCVCGVDICTVHVWGQLCTMCMYMPCEYVVCIYVHTESVLV